MQRRLFLKGLGASFSVAPLAAHAGPNLGLPTPSWRPEFVPSRGEIIDRFRYYVDQSRDFVVFSNTTCCLVADGLNEAEAVGEAKSVLQAIVAFHPDFSPYEMDDGNFMVGYNRPAYNVIPAAFANRHWHNIERDHLLGLVAGEIVLTPAGQNVFDDLGKIALLGRSYMFRDALELMPVEIVRSG